MGEHADEGEKGLDGCELDFAEEAIGDDEVEALLVPAGDEEDELDDEGDPAGPGSPDRGIATRRGRRRRLATRRRSASASAGAAARSRYPARSATCCRRSTTPPS